MLPSPCKWEGRWPWNKKEQDKKKFKQGGGGVSVRVERPDRLKALPYEKTRRRFLPSFLIEFPPFFFFPHTQKQNQKFQTIPTTNPVCLLLFPSWSRPICLREPFGGHLLHGNAINPIPFHDETQNPQRNKTTEKTFYFFGPPTPSLLSYILFKFPDEFFFQSFFLPLPLSPTEMKQMTRVKNGKLWTDTWWFRRFFFPFRKLSFYVPFNYVMTMAAVCWGKQNSKKKLQFTQKRWIFLKFSTVARGVDATETLFAICYPI